MQKAIFFTQNAIFLRTGVKYVAHAAFYLEIIELSCSSVPTLYTILRDKSLNFFTIINVYLSQNTNLQKILILSF